MMSFKVKCTTCRKTETMTEDELKKASEIGVAFSRCCHAVATVESVESRTLHLPAKKAKR